MTIPKQETGALEQLSSSGLHRETYEGDVNNKPNNHCYWNKWDQQWEENDDHFRERYKRLLEGKEPQ